jgi:hypothetical protein
VLVSSPASLLCLTSSLSALDAQVFFHVPKLHTWLVNLLVNDAPDLQRAGMETISATKAPHYPNTKYISQ